MLLRSRSTYHEDGDENAGEDHRAVVGIGAQEEPNEVVDAETATTGCRAVLGSLLNNQVMNEKRWCGCGVPDENVAGVGEEIKDRAVHRVEEIEPELEEDHLEAQRDETRRGKLAQHLGSEPAQYAHRQ
jgi:hypothetical protein